MYHFVIVILSLYYCYHNVSNTTPNVEEDRISAHEECFSCEAIASPQKWGKETDLKPWYTFDRRLECQNVHVKPNKTFVKQRPPNRWINMLMKILIPFFYNNYKCVSPIVTVSSSPELNENSVQDMGFHLHDITVIQLFWLLHLIWSCLTNAVIVQSVNNS